MTCMYACHCVAGVEASVFDTQYDIQWVADGRPTGEPLRMPRTELFRKKPVVAKPMLKTWIAEISSCETIQVDCRLLANPPSSPCLPPPPSTSLPPPLPTTTLPPGLLWIAELVTCNIAQVSCMPDVARTLSFYLLPPPPPGLPLLRPAVQEVQQRLHYMLAHSFCNIWNRQATRHTSNLACHSSD